MAPKMLGIGEGLWNIISRCHKYFQHLWKCFNISFRYKTNVRNRKRKQEKEKAYLALPGSPAGLALLAQPTRGKVVFNLVPTGSQRTQPTAPPPASPCRALRQPNPAPGDASKPLSPLPHSLLSLPSSVPLPAAHPSALVVAARCHRGHRPPLASLTRPEEPQHRPRPLRRLTPRRRPCFIVIAVIFNLGHPSPSPSIRCTPAALEPTDPPNGLTVSPRVVFPFSPGLFRPLGHSPVLAENSTPPAMSPPSLQPVRLETEHGTVLLASSGAR